MYVVSIVVCPFVLFSFGHGVLFFDIRFLIAPLVSSNYSYMKENSFFAVMNVCVVNKYGNHITAYFCLLDAFSTIRRIQHYIILIEIQILRWFYQHCRWFLLSFLLSFLQSYYIYTAYDLLCFSNCEWLIDLFIVFNATFSNISAISLRPVLVVEEAGLPGENHRPWASNW